MRIAEQFLQGKPVFSFEFFPPKNEADVEHLYETARDLAALKPTFVSVTYGAGGSTQALTIELVCRIKREIGLETMSHLTCVSHSAAEIDGVLRRLHEGGIENVLALRGDPPAGQIEFIRPADGFGYAQELVRFIKPRYSFCLGGAGYPEGHPESTTKDDDLRHLKEKVDSGVEFIITQLFFDPALYFDFVERSKALGVNLPIVPGIMPVTNVAQIQRFTKMCGASIPTSLFGTLDRLRDDGEAVTQAGIDWACRQCEQLLAGGAPGIHFYTLNRSRSAKAIFENLRLAEPAS